MSEYTLAGFKQYLRNKQAEGDTDRLCEVSTVSACRERLDDLGIAHESGAGLLFSFATIAGGWQVEVGEHLISEEYLGLDDDFGQLKEADLEQVAKQGYGGHTHRRSFGANPDEPLRELSSLTVDGKQVNSMAQTFDCLNRVDEPFDAAMSVFQDVYGFGKLSAFDFLEFAVKVNGQTEFVPATLEPDHVNRGGPKKTLERILANEADPATEVDSCKCAAILTELVQFAKEELDVDHTSAFFDIESCLCMCPKGIGSGTCGSGGC